MLQLINLANCSARVSKPPRGELRDRSTIEGLGMDVLVHKTLVHVMQPNGWSIHERV